MPYSLEQPGVLTVVLERFEKQRLPRILDIMEMLNQGGTLNNFDILFLEDVLKDTQQYKHFADEHPEFQQLYARVAHLYDQMTARALANELDA